MRARDMAEDYPLVQLSDDALDVARLMAEERRPGVVIVDEAGHPVTVLPGSQVLRFLVPGYVQDDPSLARVFGEQSAAEACVDKLRRRPVRELLAPKERRSELAQVPGDATVMECAATMARLHSPLLVVSDDDVVHGVITSSHLLRMLLGAPGRPG